MKDELGFNIDNSDLNSYHNLHFTVNNFNDLDNNQIITDNHSSKLFLVNADSIFLGDLCGRHLNRTNIHSKKQNIHFNFLKYNYFFLYEMTKQALFKQQLLNNNIEFKVLKNFYSLGNHDCGSVLKKDINNLFELYPDGFLFNKNNQIGDLIKKIDKINRFLIPTEIIFNSSTTNDVYVLSHSGGMFFLPDSTELVEEKYKDFNLKVYNYSYTKCSIQQKLFKCIEQETKDFVNKVHKAIDFDSEKKNIKNPFIWCDFFTEITETIMCDFFHRGALMDIRNTPILKILLSILKINYNLNEVNNMTIFRGHEHFNSDKNFESPLGRWFQQNNIYRVNDQKSKINFFHLAPVWFDNWYICWLIKKPKKLSFDHISTIGSSMELLPNAIVNAKELTIAFGSENIKRSDNMRYNEKKEEIFLMCLGLILPVVFMNIEKSGMLNIVIGIGSSPWLLLLVDLLSKNNNRFFYNFLLIFLPFCLSMTLVVLNNINYIHVFKNIWQYVSFTALKDNYIFLKINFFSFY